MKAKEISEKHVLCHVASLLAFDTHINFVENFLALIFFYIYMPRAYVQYVRMYIVY